MHKPAVSPGEFFPDLRSKPPRNGLRGRLVWTAATALSSLLRFAFHLIYYPLAFTYDAVAWIVSGGEWADWRRSVLPYLLPGRVLEIAHGTGTLALDMADRGFAVTAVDLSPAMGKIASRKKRKRAIFRGGVLARGSPLAPNPLMDPVLVRADVRQLPFAEERFASAVSTFPADFIFHPRTLQEVRRILQPGGRWIILPTAYPEWIAGRLLLDRRPDSPRDLFAAFSIHLAAAGFIVRTEIIRRPRSRVMLILAEKK